MDTAATLGETLRCLRSLEETAAFPIAARAETLQDGLQSLANPASHIPSIQILRSALESALHLTRQLSSKDLGGSRNETQRIDQITAAIDRASAGLGIDLTETTKQTELSDSEPPSPSDSPLGPLPTKSPREIGHRVVSLSTISSDAFSSRHRERPSAVPLSEIEFSPASQTISQVNDDASSSNRDDAAPQSRLFHVPSLVRQPSRLPSRRQTITHLTSVSNAERIAERPTNPVLRNDPWLIDPSLVEINASEGDRLTRGAPVNVFYRGEPAVIWAEASPAKLRQRMKVLDGAFHPNLATVYGAWCSGTSRSSAVRSSEVYSSGEEWLANNSFVVQEHVEGQLLRDQIRSGTMGLGRKLEVARGVAMALMYLESRAQPEGICTPTISSADIVWSTESERPVVIGFKMPKDESNNIRQTLRGEKASLSFGVFLEELYHVNRLEFTTKRPSKHAARATSDSASISSAGTGTNSNLKSAASHASSCPYLIQDLIVGCSKSDPLSRMSLPQIVTMLDMLLLEAKKGPRGFKSGPKHVIPKLHRKYELRLDAKRGDPLAQMELGYRYEFADEVEQSPDEACRYYRLALEQGYRDAGHALRRCTAKSRDRGSEAASFYESVYARDKSHPIALVRYALVLFWGVGTKADKERSAKILKECISLHGNYPQALHALGCAYQLGQGVSENMSRAARLFAVAAEKGYSPAQLEYGRFLMTITKDIETANFWIAQSVEQNHPGAQHAFAIALKDESENMRATLEMKAAEQGYAAAQAGLAFCFQKGLGLPLNDEQALQWYRRAADQGHPESMRQVGWFYLKGYGGVRKDSAAGRDWLVRAKKQGSVAAERDLLKIAPRPRKKGICL